MTSEESYYYTHVKIFLELGCAKENKWTHIILYEKGECMEWPAACLGTDGGRAGCTDLYLCPHVHVRTHTHKHTHTNPACMAAYVNT